MDQAKLAVAAWAVFLGGFVVLAAVHSWQRSHGTAMSDKVWFGVPATLAIVAAPLLWRSTSPHRPAWIRGLLVACHAVAGFVIYTAMCLWYVVGTGLDGQ
ncbi:hypothetical protein [Lacipirellula sp.]|uniref:hypothetical protein n=1 Tax=Lacipirellula sp. TaxID=2691419 RepID=UPI003D136A74